MFFSASVYSARCHQDATRVKGGEAFDYVRAWLTTTNREIVIHPGGKVYRAAANGTANRWMLERHLLGEWDREAYYSHNFTLYDGSGGLATFDIYRGASRIAGGAPALKWRFANGNSGVDNAANRNYLQAPTGNRISFGAGSPESVVTAPVGSLYGQTDGGAGTCLYVKETGTGSTGWVAK